MRKSRSSRVKQNKLIEHFVAGTTARTAADLVGVNRKTAAYYFHRLRIIISQHLEVEASEFLSGEIEIDESYFGAPIISTKSNNSTIMLDGTLSEGEWKDAKKLELTKGGEAFYKFVGVHGVSEGWITIYATDGKNIYALHASAALGTALYTNENESWKNTQKFKYEARDASMSAEAVKAREDFYKANGWVANVSKMGEPNEREFKISNKFFAGKKMKIAIVYSADTKPISLQYFPKMLADDTLNMDLIIGNTPSDLKFEMGSWAEIEPEQQ